MPLSTSWNDATINLLAPRSTIKTCEHLSVVHLSWSVRSVANVCGQFYPISLIPLCYTRKTVSFPGVYLTGNQAWKHSSSVALLIETVARTETLLDFPFQTDLEVKFRRWKTQIFTAAVDGIWSLQWKDAFLCLNSTITDLYVIFFFIKIMEGFSSAHSSFKGHKNGKQSDVDNKSITKFVTDLFMFRFIFKVGL